MFPSHPPLRPPGIYPARVVRPRIEPGRRVIAVSDIHGNLPCLQGLLKKIRFSQDDVLILVGDLLEKGRYSLATLRYVMELQKIYTVYPLCGNCDHIDRVFLEGPPGADRELWPILSYWGERSTLMQMGAELGHRRPRKPEDLPALRAALLDYFPRETRFLMDLPHILETGNYIFVHGGIPREDRLEELDAYGCMKNDDFLNQGYSFRKWVVVGHWPVTLLDPAIQRCAPLVEEGRHIVCIDGGCVLNVEGQLNAMLIPDVEGDGFGFSAYDGLPQITALDAQQPSSDSVNIRWSDSEVEVLGEDRDCVFVRHPSSGRTLWLPRDHVSRWRDGKIHAEGATDYRLPVLPGDVLTLVRETRRGLLVKKDGITGWYHGRAKRA